MDSIQIWTVFLIGLLSGGFVSVAVFMYIGKMTVRKYGSREVADVLSQYEEEDE